MIDSFLFSLYSVGKILVTQLNHMYSSIKFAPGIVRKERQDELMYIIIYLS